MFIFLKLDGHSLAQLAPSHKACFTGWPWCVRNRSSLEVPAFLLWSLDRSGCISTMSEIISPFRWPKRMVDHSTSISPLHRMGGFLQEYILYSSICQVAILLRGTRDSACGDAYTVRLMRLSQVTGTRPETRKVYSYIARDPTYQRPAKTSQRIQRIIHAGAFGIHLRSTEYGVRSSDH